MANNTTYIKLDDGWEGEVHHKWTFPADVIKKWEALADLYGDSGIFIGYSWFENWWNVFGLERELFVVIMRNNGVINGIFPCQITDSTGTEIISSLTNSETGYYDFVISPESRKEALSAFIRLIRQMKPEAQLHFDYLHLSTENASLFIEELNSEGVPLYEYGQPWAPWLTLDRVELPEFKQNLSGRLRKNLKTCLKRAEKQGTISLKIIRNIDQLDENLSAFFEIEFDGWKGREGSAIKCNPDVEAFYRRLVHWGAMHGHLLLFILELNDKPIAGFLCLYSGHTVFGIKIGYRESYGHISPGNLLISKMVHYLAESSKASVFDFLGACDPWKVEWTSKVGSSGWIKIYPKSVKGWTRYMFEYGYKNYLKPLHSLKRFKEEVERLTGRRRMEWNNSRILR